MERDKKVFTLPKGAIQSQASITIAAPPEQVAAVYRDVEKWGEIYPATIACAQVVRSGDHWKEIEVEHKQEGCVPNTLFDLSDTEIGLEEQKKKFDAWFINQFLPAANGGTHYIIYGYARLKGVYKLLSPLLKGYVHRQTVKRMRGYVLEPLKAAAERERH